MKKFLAACLLLSAPAFAQQPPNCAVGGFITSPDGSQWVCTGTGTAPTRIGSTSVLVTSVANFPAPVAGVITLAPAITYIVDGSVDLGTNRIVWGARSAIMGTNRVNDVLTYSGTGTAFTIASGAVVGFFKEIGLRAPTGTLIDVSGASVAFVDTAFGTIQSGGAIALSGAFSFGLRTSSAISAFTTTGFTFTGTSTSACRIFDNLVRNNAGTMFAFGTAAFSVIDVGRNVVDNSAGQTFMSGTTGGANVTASGILVSNSFVGAGTGVSAITATDTNWFFGSNTGVTDSIEPVVQTALNAKQATLVSATNIKTINGSTVLGSGDLVVSGSGAAWGAITGTLSAQTDLQTALDGKQASGSYATGTGSANGTNTGDQTSIVGITGSLAEFNTALTGADFATGGGTASGTNTGDQTSVTGNAGTATTLQNARTINGVSFNGSANITVTAAADTLTGTTLAALSGVNLTNLDASDLASGTVPDSRFPATLPAASGVNLTALNASNLASGTAGTARLGSGTANSGTFLRGDSTWAAPPGAPTYVVTVADTTNATTSYANITGLSWSIAASTRYRVSCVVPYDANATTTGIGVGWTGPASPTLTRGLMTSGLTTATIGGTTSVGNDTGGVTTASVATTNNVATFEGIWSNGANSGTLQMRVKSEVAIANAIIVRTGAVCSYAVY